MGGLRKVDGWMNKESFVRKKDKWRKNETKILFINLLFLIINI